METQLQIAPAAVAPRRPLPPALFLLLAALTTAGLLWLCYFPANCGWLAWFALVPFLVLVRSTARPRWVYLCAWVCGLAFYFPALQWMRVADPRMVYAWIMLAVYCSLYFPIALRIIRFLDRRTVLPLILTLPLVWTALEFVRTWLFTGFSWYLLAYTQHDFLPVIQFADLTGAYGVTFLVAAVNAVLFEALSRWDWSPYCS
jgi:apolipoprotein N-acyltransferase